MSYWFKYILLLLLSLSSLVHAEQPQQIIEAWQACQLKSEMDPVCIKIGHQALKLRDLIELLQASPQGFGLEIMQLQSDLMHVDLATVKKNGLREDLALRLAIVGWLESPK